MVLETRGAPIGFPYFAFSGEMQLHSQWFSVHSCGQQDARVQCNAGDFGLVLHSPWFPYSEVQYFDARTLCLSKGACCGDRIRFGGYPSLPKFLRGAELGIVHHSTPHRFPSTVHF